MARADPECVGGVLAALREEYPERPLNELVLLIDWETIRFYGETIGDYRARDEVIRQRRLDGLRSLL